MNLETKNSKKFNIVIHFGQRGFTLVELIMTLVMSTIVLSGIYVIVSGSHKYIIDGRKKNRLQQDFSLIDLVLATNIRQGIFEKRKIYNSYSDYIGGQPSQSSGSCLKLYFTSGDISVFYLNNMDFKIQKTDSSITNLVSGVVSNLLFTQGTKSIQTDLNLSQNGKAIAGNLIHAFKNEVQ